VTCQQSLCMRPQTYGPISNMPSDKHANGNPAKPFTPTLSSHFRSTKSPLTPNLIGSAQSSPALSPCREIRTRITPWGGDEPLASPLNGNVTTRSGPRNSRIGTESPATPGGSKGNMSGRMRAGSISESLKRSPGNGGGRVGLGISSPGANLTASTRPTNAVVSTPSLPSTAARQVATKSERGVSPQFFRAGQVRAKLDTQEVVERPKLGPKASTFFYAIGSTSASSVKTEPARANSFGTSTDDDKKFFHANDAPVTLSQPAPGPMRPTLSKKHSSASMTSPVTRSPDLQQASRSKARARAPSPLKDTPLNSRSTRPISPQRQLNMNSTSSNDVRNKLDRRKSIGSNVSVKLQPDHKKSASTSIFNLNLTPIRNTISPKPITPPRLGLRVNPQAKIMAENTCSINLPDFPASPESVSPQSTSLTSTNTIATSDTDCSEPIRLQSPIKMKSPTTLAPQHQPSAQSPKTTTQTPLQRQAELAAAARRERKVLDLEISNSSLLAINKTLEREMRKQSAELRRFRRLSRSGRLSLATGDSLRSASGASGLSTLNEDPEDMDDPDPDDIPDGLNDLDASSDFSDDELESTVSTSSSLNPASASSLSPKSRTLRRRHRDEKRLLLDLSKHQQLLIDSQKLNQSIRRCVGWTEEMIREGQKALQYRVEIGDVPLGGRVLREDDDESDEHELAGRSEQADPIGWPGKEEKTTESVMEMIAKMEEAVKWDDPDRLQAFVEGTPGGSPTLLPNR
jgi:hypothetical protein